MSVLSKEYFHNEEAAYAYVESKLWSGGIVCPHCGVVGNSKKLQGKSTRIGVHKCYDCYKPFTVKVGTIFEGSNVKLHIWLQAMYLMAVSKKGVSSNQLHRILGVTLKTAWFMSHRIREAMKPRGEQPLLGGEGKTIEADEFYVGKAREKKNPWSRGWAHKNKVFSMIERGGHVRSQHVESTKAEHLRPIMLKNADTNSRLMTDEALWYLPLGKMFSSHHSTNHSARQYVDAENSEIHSNTVENYYSILRKGLGGTYQHCKSKHLHRYLSEFDFRHNTRTGLGVDDAVRSEQLLMGVVGKRLKYKH